MDEIRLRANGLHFGALIHGEGPKRALLLHGFPDEPHSFEPMMELLAEEGYRCVAPWMRGYGPTDAPPDGDFQVAALAADAVGLLDALDWESTLLVGHDWGAVAGYAACNMSPYRVEHLVGLSVPPMRAFLKNSLRHPSQFRRSWYMFFFQLPLLPEWWLSHDDFETLEELWTGVLRAAGRDTSEVERVKNTFRHPGTLESSLSYYRALLPGRAGTLGGFRESLDLALGRIERPTLVMAGDEDPAIGIETFENLDDAFESRWRFRRLDGAGHFIQVERPDEIVDEVLDFVAGDN